ncbi:shikimate dehydrogenase [Rubellimicrobium rubrum]|uniref:Shikimate dehydrogenase (NADP(+)) n=1 Tax=Rubellimicrobium rubrum TaxID=2585369 RepID=A0A5C4MRL5_9RHOB|nr:shikimate dehydrogenase [Rubellimicrobium rubrum]TNC48164.1 shikimate dehydrogenase [Rubellimicrobium rubrum]
MTHGFPLAGVVGRPIAHSRSPRLHRHWLARHGIAGDYVAMEIGEGDLEQVLRILPRAGFRGVNVTIPHKMAALSLADEATDRARQIGAANLLVFEGNRILADNTDGEGFLNSVRQGAPGWDPSTGAATVLGAGGAARAVIVTLLEAGAPEILLTNRTRATAEGLRDEFGDRIRVFDWVKAGNAVEEGTMVVNTTSLGMLGNPELRVPLDGLRPGQVVTDLVYSPLETRLLQQARKAGAQGVDGLGMLLHQAAPAFERWFGLRPQVDDALRAAVLA